MTAPDGHYVAQDLPFGVYRLSLHADGFAAWSNLIEIRSEVPVRASITLGVAPVTTQVQVNDSATLVDPSRTGVITPWVTKQLMRTWPRSPDAAFRIW